MRANTLQSNTVYPTTHELGLAFVLVYPSVLSALAIGASQVSFASFYHSRDPAAKALALARVALHCWTLGSAVFDSDVGWVDV